MAGITGQGRLGALLRRIWKDDTYSVALAQRLTVDVIGFAKTAVDGAANTATSLAIFVADRPLKLLAARYIPHDTLTAHDTNYATIALKVSSTSLASQTTKITGGSGNFVSNAPVNLTLGTTVTMAVGDVLLFSIAKSGSGVAVPAGVIQAVVCEQ